jgi:hypothetical protein
LSTTYKILSNILLSRLTPYVEKILGIVSVNFNATIQLLILYCAFVKHLRKNGNKMMHHLIIDFKKSYDSVTREVLYNLIEFGIPMKLVRLTKMSLN